MGYLWSLLKPLFLFAILYVVFVKIIKVEYGVPHSGPYLLLGVVLWNFFAELTGSSVTSVVSRGDIIRKLNFPKYVIVLSTALSSLINLTLNLLAAIFFLLIDGGRPSISWLVSPILILELFIFSLGIGFFLSSVFVKLRDIGHVWDVILQGLFYATPILFPLSYAPLWLQKIIILNPVAQVVQDLRSIVISDKTINITDVYKGEHSTFVRLIPVTIVLLVTLSAAAFFRRSSKSFAENI